MTAAPAVAGPGLARAAMAVSGWNALSRVTGFARVIALGAAVGTTFLGNTYQSANLVSTVTFELMAAGILSAPLVPLFVRLLESGRKAEAERLAGTLVVLSLVGLGILALLLAGAGEWVMRILTSGVGDEAVRADEIRLGRFLLWFFAPQMLLYAVGAVATALLNAQRRFSAAAFAPVANNILVIATLALFVALRHGQPPSLRLDLGPRLVLAVGTTLGVVAMTAVPLVGLVRSGVGVRLCLELSSPELRQLARDGRWVVLLLGGGQALIAVTLVLSNQVAGGVVAYQVAFTFFLLPFALIAHPIFTVLHPRLSAHAAADRWADFGDDVAGGVLRVLLLVLPAAAVLGVLGGRALQLTRFGALDVEGAALVGRVLAAYALGLAGYAVFQMMARACMAAGDPRLPALVGLGVAGTGSLLMVVCSATASVSDRVVVLGLVHSLVVTAGAVILAVLLGRRLGRPLGGVSDVLGPVAVAAAAGGAALLGVGVVDAGGRSGAAVDLVVAGGAASLTVAGALLWLARAQLGSSPAPERT
ncbi:MAG TPA: lipid II flippase MurJ [Acidimicrobiales bacterium]|nr:lipid II flippase MurJ [Acidimicrobiales bacterium]